MVLERRLINSFLVALPGNGPYMISTMASIRCELVKVDLIKYCTM